jgi:hypothetical protein
MEPPKTRWGCRRIGRPKLRWMDGTVDDLRMLNVRKWGLRVLDKRVISSSSSSYTFKFCTAALTPENSMLFGSQPYFLHLMAPICDMTSSPLALQLTLTACNLVCCVVAVKSIFLL